MKEVVENLIKKLKKADVAWSEGEGILIRPDEAKILIEEIQYLLKVHDTYKHYFNAPDDDKSSRICRCGRYLTDDIHHRPTS